MPREKELFRDQLERVIERFPGRELIPVKDVSTWLGVTPTHLYRSEGTPCKHLGGRYYVTAIALARWLASD